MNHDNPDARRQIDAARKEAMTAFAGAWKDSPEFADPEAYVRSLRQGRRLQGLRSE
jgi:hypothetical protein